MRVINGKLNIRSETLKARLDYVNVLKVVLKLGFFKAVASNFHLCCRVKISQPVEDV